MKSLGLIDHRTQMEFQIHHSHAQLYVNAPMSALLEAPFADYIRSSGGAARVVISSTSQ